MPRGRNPQAGHRKENSDMAIILLVLLLAIILGGLGFAIHVLWWIALAVLVLWLIGFLVRVGEGTSRSRWYRW
jgi:membrane protein YdbS with pleckstrin-like domain